MVSKDRNKLSEGLSYITNKAESVPNAVETLDSTTEEPATRAFGGSFTMVFGTDNSLNEGQGIGSVYRSSSTYYTYLSYYMYTYKSGTNYERHGWSTFDLSDMKQYTGLTVNSGAIWWRHDYRYRAAQQISGP